MNKLLDSVGGEQQNELNFQKKEDAGNLMRKHLYLVSQMISK